MNTNQPPNPAKLTDPRAEKYIQEFGNKSWELDALEPRVLNELLEFEIEKLIDMDQYNEIIKEEEYDKKKLLSIQL